MPIAAMGDGQVRPVVVLNGQLLQQRWNSAAMRPASRNWAAASAQHHVNDVLMGHRAPLDRLARQFREPIPAIP